MQLLRLELGQGSQKENWPLGSVLGGGCSADVTGNNEGYKETMTWTRLPGLSRLKTQLLQRLSGLILNQVRRAENLQT